MESTESAIFTVVDLRFCYYFSLWWNEKSFPCCSQLWVFFVGRALLTQHKLLSTYRIFWFSLLLFSVLNPNFFYFFSEHWKLCVISFVALWFIIKDESHPNYNLRDWTSNEQKENHTNESTTNEWAARRSWLSLSLLFDLCTVAGCCCCWVDEIFHEMKLWDDTQQKTFPSGNSHSNSDDSFGSFTTSLMIITNEIFFKFWESTW